MEVEIISVTAIANTDEDFICATMDYGPSNMCNYSVHGLKLASLSWYISFSFMGLIFYYQILPMCDNHVVSERFSGYEEQDSC